jgi:hypothetical protein
MNEQQQAIVSLVTQRKAKEAADQLLTLKDNPSSFFLPIFDGSSFSL